jgi:hypothetical protein
MIDQPVIPLPTSRLLGAVLGTSALVGLIWILISAVLGHEGQIVLAGLAAAIIVGACTAAGLLVITPWRPRPVSQWVSLWLAQTVVRLLVTPLVSFLLYSAAPLGAIPLALAVGLTYLAAVLSEAGVVRRYLQRSRSA